MHRDFDNSDFFDDDELSIGCSSERDNMVKGDAFPFKIGLNFIKEDDYSVL
jgi:hypothetical protein